MLPLTMSMHSVIFYSIEKVVYRYQSDCTLDGLLGVFE